MADSSEPRHIINSLRVSGRVLGMLLDKLDKGDPSEGPPVRQFVRWKYRQPIVEMQVARSNGDTITHYLASRNISRQGISLLHSAYMYPGTPCRIILRTSGGTARILNAVVRRCEHRGGKVHEVGLQFETELSLRDIIGLDPIDEGYSIETVEPERLQGTVLVAAASEIEEQIMLRMLEQSSIHLQVARDPGMLKERVAKSCDLLMIDASMCDGSSGIDALSELRSDGFDAPAIMLVAECSDMNRDAARMAGATGVISKPIDERRLLQATAEFLMGDSDGGPIYSTLKSDNPAWDLIGKYMTEMPRMVLDLEKGLRDGDKAACERLCRKLVSTAEPMGFAELGEMARRALLALDRTAHPREAGAEIRALMIACRRVRFRAA